MTAWIVDNRAARALFYAALTICLALSFAMTASNGYAEETALKNIPDMPQDTLLFNEEKMFAYRGRIGGYFMRPSKYGIYEDDKVYYPGPDGNAPPHASIKVMYLRDAGKSFCGTYVLIFGDISKYATMTFMIKGQTGGETFEIGVNDVISNKREDAVMIGSIYRYLPQGITNEWQKVVIPLSDFFGVDLTRVYSIVFDFTESGKGAFWIDDIKFSTDVLTNREEKIYSQGYLLLDNFDHSDLNLLGRKANVYKKLPSTCEFTRVSEPRVGKEGRSLELAYEKKTTGWCGYYSLLNQIDGEYFDLSKYKAASFMVRGERGKENFEIGMADKNWLNIGDSIKAGPIDKYLPKGVTKEWQEVVVPLKDFGKLDFTQMGAFVINFYKKERGAVYIDDLKFILKTEDELLKEWEAEEAKF